MANTTGWITSVCRRCRNHWKWKRGVCWTHREFWKDVIWKVLIISGSIFLYWQFQRFEWQEKRITVEHLKDPILNVNPELQMVRTSSGAFHIEVLVKLENEGVADVDIQSIEISASRGAPKQRLHEVLEALSKPPRPPAPSSEIVDSLDSVPKLL